jgi:hypothetical protein
MAAAGESNPGAPGHAGVDRESAGIPIIGGGDGRLHPGRHGMSAAGFYAPIIRFEVGASPAASLPSHDSDERTARR